MVRVHRLRVAVSASAVLLAAISALAAVRGPVAYGRTAVAPRTAGTTKVAVSATEFAFKLSRKTAPVGRVVFTLTNNGQLPHDIRIGGKTSQLVGPGSSTTLTVKFTKTGRYQYLCTVPGHAAQGMEGKLTVTK
jgi:uncharacterized cupredoxin-like copper-binding protein